MKRHGNAHIFATDKLRSCGAAMKVIGSTDKQETGRWLNNRAENSKQSFRRKEREMICFRRMRTLQKFVAVHASIHGFVAQIVLRACFRLPQTDLVYSLCSGYAKCSEAI
jgi:putative transposase